MEFYTQQPWMRKPRNAAVKYIIIHSTRGNTANDKQYQATINWFQNPINKTRVGNSDEYWGSSADYVVGTKGEVAKTNADLTTSRAISRVRFHPLPRHTFIRAG